MKQTKVVIGEYLVISTYGKDQIKKIYKISNKYGKHIRYEMDIETAHTLTHTVKLKNCGRVEGLTVLMVA